MPRVRGILTLVAITQISGGCTKRSIVDAVGSDQGLSVFRRSADLRPVRPYAVHGEQPEQHERDQDDSWSQARSRLRQALLRVGRGCHHMRV